MRVEHSIKHDTHSRVNALAVLARTKNPFPTLLPFLAHLCNAALLIPQQSLRNPFYSAVHLMLSQSRKYIYVLDYAYQPHSFFFPPVLSNFLNSTFNAFLFPVLETRFWSLSNKTIFVTISSLPYAANKTSETRSTKLHSWANGERNINIHSFVPSPFVLILPKPRNKIFSPCMEKISLPIAAASTQNILITNDNEMRPLLPLNLILSIFEAPSKLWSSGPAWCANSHALWLQSANSDDKLNEAWTYLQKINYTLAALHTCECLCGPLALYATCNPTYA